jgi:uncharacterized membrane protein YfcA
MELHWASLALALAGGLGAGFLNAIAGGGTLVSFPLLVAGGLSPLTANITSTIALCPGYMGGIQAQWRDVKTLGARRIGATVASAALGAALGGLLLVRTGENDFNRLVPWLLFLASGLLAFTPAIKKLIFSHRGQPASHWLAIPVFFSAIYGGFFGAGMSVIVLAVLGLWSGEPLNKLNAHKQVIGLTVNGAAAVYFLFGTAVAWPAVAAMSAGALLGGWFGGKTATAIRPEMLRWTAVTIGFGAGWFYL